MCTKVMTLTLVQTPLVLIILIGQNKIKRTHRASFYTMLKITFIKKNLQIVEVIVHNYFRQKNGYLCSVKLGD